MVQKTPLCKYRLCSCVELAAGKLAAGTQPEFLYERDIVPGETVDLTGDVNNSDNGADEYDSCSSVEEEEIDDD